MSLNEGQQEELEFWCEHGIRALTCAPKCISWEGEIHTLEREVLPVLKRLLVVNEETDET